MVGSMAAFLVKNANSSRIELIINLIICSISMFQPMEFIFQVSRQGESFFLVDLVIHKIF